MISDFIEQPHAGPNSLRIVGDDSQKKCYIHVTDCVNAMPYIVEYATKQKEQIHTFNLGNEKTTSVDDIAETASDVLGVDRAFMYTGGEREWTGDVPKNAAFSPKADFTEMGTES